MGPGNLKILYRLTIIALIILGGFFVTQKSVEAAPGINKQINFQGKVTNSDGTNVATGNYNFNFKIYTVSSGGTEVWSELAKSLTVTDGIFQTNLGDATALPGSVDFNSDNVYLGIEFNSNGEMSPRVHFTAAPYAFNSDTLDGKDWTNPGNIGTSATTLALASNGTSAWTNTSGNLTISTATSGTLAMTSAGALNLTGSGASYFNTTSGNINLEAAGTGTANIQIGDGGATSATPDLLVLDIGSAEPAGTNGAMYYSTALNKFRCYQNSGWADCIGTGGSGPWTDGSGISYLTDTAEDFAVGGSVLASPFSVDVSLNTTRIGSGSTNNGILNMYASDADTGSLEYTTNDSWYFNGGNIGIGTNNPSEALDINGRIHLSQLSAPGTTTDKLYNVSGDLYWNGGVVNKKIYTLAPANDSATGGNSTTPYVIGTNGEDILIVDGTNLTGHAYLLLDDTASAKQIDVRPHDVPSNVYVNVEFTNGSWNGDEYSLTDWSGKTGFAISGSGGKSVQLIGVVQTSGYNRWSTPSSNVTHQHMISWEGGSDVMDGYENRYAMDSVDYTKVNSNVFPSMDVNNASAYLSLTSSGTTGGSEARLNLTRNGVNQWANAVYQTGATAHWAVGLRAGDENFHFHDEETDTDSLVLEDATGNVGIGATNPDQKLTVDGTFGIIETGTTPTYHTIFQGGDQTGADITYTLPVDGMATTGLLKNTNGVWSWDTSAYTTHAAVTLGTANGLSLSTQQLSLGAASSGVTGALTGTDWDTFNGKMTNPMTTAGDIVYGGASGAPTRLGEGTNDGYVLKINTTTHVPYWSLDLTGGGAQTPWAQDISAAGYDLGSLSNLGFQETTGAPTGTDVGLHRDNSGDLTANVLTGKTFNFAVNGADEFNFSSTGLAFNSNNITGLGTNLTATAGLTIAATGANALNLTGGAASAWNIGANALTITSSNFNTTATGINSTAIGATTASTGAFSTLSSTGATNLATAGASNVTIATTGTGTVAIGNATGTFALASSGGLNVSTGGALTGVASIDTIGVTATGLTFAGTGAINSTTTGLSFNSGNNTLTVDSSDTSLTASGVTTLTLGAGVSITNASGNIGLQAAGTGTANVQIGDGGATSATPDMLVLDIGSAEPTGTVGAMYYSTALTKFRCYQGAAWTDCIGAGGAQTPWAQDISAAGYDLGSLSNLGFQETTGAPTGTDVGLYRDNTGDLTANVLTGKTFNFAVNGADEFNFSSTGLAFNSNDITGLGANLTAAGALTIASATASGLTLNSGTTGAIAIGDDNSAETINIGTGGAVKTLVIGSTNTSSITTIQSGTAGISLAVAGTATGTVQIGTGGAGSNTPDIFALDVKNNTGDPSGFEGAMYYNTTDNLFRCYQNTAWTNCIGSGSGGGDNVSVNGTAKTDANFSDTTVATPAGGANVKWQSDTSTPNNISAYFDFGDYSQAFRKKPTYAADFGAGTATTANLPFTGAAVGTGGNMAAANAGIVNGDHPGVVKLRSGTAANAGYRYTTEVAGIRLKGGEIFNGVLYLNSYSTETVRLGFIDSITSTDEVDGCYFEIPTTGAAVGKCANNSTRTTSTGSYTIALSTWYTFRITMNSNATSATFEIFNTAGTSLFTTNNTVGANIPTASGRETGAGIVITSSRTAAADLLHLDYMGYSFGSTNALAR